MNKNLKKINIPERDLKNKPLTVDQIKKEGLFIRRLKLIEREFRKGFDYIKKQPKSITFFGSARFKEDNIYYQQARELASLLSQENYAIVTGGGPGIMEAANRGAVENNSNGKSIGYCIQLPDGQVTNPYVIDHLNFHYFFIRKVMLSFSAKAYIFFPGGFGTMDEFFEILTLVQTDKIPKVPIILFGSEYWNRVDSLIKESFIEKYKTIDKSDRDFYVITDDYKEVLDLIKK